MNSTIIVLTRTSPETLNVTNIEVLDGRPPKAQNIYYTGLPFKVPGTRDSDIPEVGKTNAVVNVRK